MDLLLTEMGVADPPIGTALNVGSTADEVTSAAVDPGTYWVWAATYDSSLNDPLPPAPTLPVSYDITICAF
jgi:hypothetical protein